jgi:hypothetical protein
MEHMQNEFGEDQNPTIFGKILRGEIRLTPPRGGSLHSASLHLGAQARTLGLRPPPRPSPVSFVRP